MDQIKYRHLNLDNIRSNLFEMLSKYDSDFLEKPINFVYGNQIIYDFNNRNVNPENINLIIEFCNYLAIDHQLIQSFIINNSTPSFTPYQLNVEIEQKYYLPQFMKHKNKNNTNIFLETCKLGLINWFKFSIDNNLRWSNQAFYYSIINGNQLCYQLLCNHDQQNFFQNNLLAIINYKLKNKVDLNVGNIIYFIKDIFIETNYSSCPSSAPSSSSSFYNGNILSCQHFFNYLKKSFSFYQVYFKTDKECRAVKIKITNNELIIPSIINGAQYSNQWESIFIDVAYLAIPSSFSLDIKICIYIESLDYENIILDEKNLEIKIPIIKENMNSFNFLVFSFNNINSNNLWKSNIFDYLHCCSKLDNKKGIYGYINNDCVLVDKGIENFDNFKDHIIDIETPVNYKKIINTTNYKVL